MPVKPGIDLAPRSKSKTKGITCGAHHESSGFQRPDYAIVVTAQAEQQNSQANTVLKRWEAIRAPYFFYILTLLYKLDASDALYLSLYFLTHILSIWSADVAFYAPQTIIWIRFTPNEHLSSCALRLRRSKGRSPLRLPGSTGHGTAHSSKGARRFGP